eukprot:4043499-Prymnesium_polylepis.1
MCQLVAVAGTAPERVWPMRDAPLMRPAGESISPRKREHDQRPWRLFYCSCMGHRSLRSPGTMPYDDETTIQFRVLHKLNRLCAQKANEATPRSLRPSPRCRSGPCAQIGIDREGASQISLEERCTCRSVYLSSFLPVVKLVRYGT